MGIIQQMEKNMKNCGVCNKEFEPKNYWQQYCCPTCKQAAWALRKYDRTLLKKIVNGDKK
jgi:uncharacterized CHY-type Zn-finger protein